MRRNLFKTEQQKAQYQANKAQVITANDISKIAQQLSGIKTGIDILITQVAVATVLIIVSLL